MNSKADTSFFSYLEKYPVTNYIVKWLMLSVIIGVLVGIASAFFLWSLNLATNWRESHVWIISLLPIGGLLIGLLYHYYGQDVVKGNNQLFDEMTIPQKKVPLKMAPLVLIGTILTHFFGGSAGREGTAVQMGGSIADQFPFLFKLNSEDRKIALILGISAGFASVFGTPLAGAIFALEVMVLGKLKYKAFIPSFLVAYISHYTCIALPIAHTHYSIPQVPPFEFSSFFWSVLAGILFGFAAMIFAKSTRGFTSLFSKVSYPPLRPFIGGIVIALVVWGMGTTKYIGLGVPLIVDSFTENIDSYAFILKIALTAFTLGAGFKGGEVTPLFFIGATLGNLLFWFIPLPMALLAGMGFVAVFSGATNTPIACTVMGLELFGLEGGVYIAIACFVAYFFSGKVGIYSSQIVGRPKDFVYNFVFKS